MKDTKEQLITEKEILKVQKITKSTKIKEKGITLIALVVTIIILLILAGVSIEMIMGENGLFGQTQKAVKSYDTASEMETLSLSVLNYNMSNNEADKLGEKLSKMSTITGDWKNVTVGKNTYKDGWYLVEKGEEITGYGEAKLNWLINYDTGEIIELKEGEYTIASANASGAIVDETLKLNIDPSNMQDESQWGDGVSFVGGNGSSDSGVKETEIKFDGVDDYLKIENVKLEKSEGITLEFYDRNYGKVIHPLCKNYFENNEIKRYTPKIRTELSKTDFRCTFGEMGVDCGSEYRMNSESERHWLVFENMKIRDNDFDYVSLCLDFSKHKLKIYDRGKLKYTTNCSEEYLNSGDLFDDDVPFSCGVMVHGTDSDGLPMITFSKFDLYACRLYTRVLSDTEIVQNYTATTNYHNELVK